LVRIHVGYYDEQYDIEIVRFRQRLLTPAAAAATTFKFLQLQTV